MNDNSESRNLANDVRFTIDKKINFGKNRNEIDFYNFGVEITKSLEPTLYDSISCASSRLFIKINDIKTFVYPYDSIQASCIDFEDSCVIRISSAAIDKLSYDEIKFVIGNQADFDWAKAKIYQYNLDDKCTLLMSPTFGEIEPHLIAKWILEHSLPVRMQIQMHKMIWNPEKKGV